MSNRSERLNAQIYEQASVWLVEFRTGDVSSTERRRFNAWLRTSPEHVRAYLELAAIWNEGAGLDPARDFEGDELADVARENVVPLSSAVEAPLKSPRGHSLWYAVAASCAMIGVALSAWLYAQRGSYETDIGELRSITLSDGSTVELNARTELRERFRGDRRRVELIRGEAFFHVAKDESRPFIVESGHAQIRAVGTQFDVYRKPSGSTVTVVEGRVAVLPSYGSDGPGSADTPQTRTPHEVLLIAGEQVTVTAQTAVTHDKSDVTAATAWLQRRLVFEAAPLKDVAEEFNRYNKRRLVIETPKLTELKITGIFSSTDPAALLRFLAARPGITVTERGDEILVSQSP